MRRWWLVGLVVVACGRSNPTASGDATQYTPRFQPLACTSGNPGDPTCPINHVALPNPGGEIDFVAQESPGALGLSNINVVAGTLGLYVQHLAFVADPCDGPAPATAPTIDLSPGVTGPYDPTTNNTLQLFNANQFGDVLCLAFDAIGPVR